MQSALRIPALKIIAGSLSLQTASCSIPAIALLLVGVSATQVMAGTAPAPTPSSVVGDTVRDAATNADVTVVALITDSNGDVSHVVTSDNKMLLTKTTIGAVLYISDGGDPAVITQKEVISVEENATSGLVEKVNVRTVGADTEGPTSPVEVSLATTQTPDIPGGVVDAPGGGAAVNPPVTTTGVIDEISRGSGGSGGKNGYGVRICIPIIGCATIGYSGTSGGDGSAGTAVNRTILSSHGLIEGSGANGITIASVGGKGGNGGNSYGSLKGLSGGDGGAGGNVTVNNSTDVTVSGTSRYGLNVYSRSGDAGSAGSNYGLGQGAGKGGVGRNGGTVNVTNSGSITTRGDGGHGIYVYSSGGSGGSGGGGWSIVGEGGSGAKGGDGGNVTVTNHGQVDTFGKGAHGILAQSIGGTGGDGGSAGGIVAFGGDASEGGIGKDVRVNAGSGSEINTKGDFSSGIVAQSIGGSGGDSGSSGGIVSLGGSGGSGNNAGSVNISTAVGSLITTKGQGSDGILAQSIGGGGGNAGASGGLVSLGGSGSGGGNGDVVNLSNSGGIRTDGRDSRGILAQSIGGGGGNGGVSGGLVSLGGSGSSGGNGLGVTVRNNAGGDILTKGVGSDAIFAQSIGGGGGAGAASGGLVSLGGNGSSGGSSGAVTVTNDANIETTGRESKGIFAQSIAGGGGSGGASGGLVSLGGGSSRGSDANTVTITNSGDITTREDNSLAIFAQSIGGGGGNGGSSGGAISIGGSGSGGGNGGIVRATNTGVVNTYGDFSGGVFAQSVGGGGGNGGTSGGIVSIGGSGGSGSNSNLVEARNGRVIHTRGSDSTGIFAQSVGGGGGNGGSSYSGGLFAGFSLGGSGSSGGNGGTARVILDDFSVGGVTLPSLVVTEGDRSTGILAQSVGGGGGNGGNAVQATVGTGVSMSVAIGGSGGSGGLGGTVSMTGTGDVTTLGNNASGVILQSVGGGGGNGGTTVSAAASIGDGVAIGVAIGGSGGSGGQGGIVTSNVTSVINTTGAFSTGFVAQSIGGGGGNGGTTVAASAAVGAIGAGGVSVAVGSDGGSGGNGGTVNSTLAGSVTTTGVQSDGVIVQSIGGGGGNGGTTIAASAAGGGVGAGAITVGVGSKGGVGGVAGSATADIDSDVTTMGDGSDGVIVQSIGGGGGNSGLTISAGFSGGGVGAGGVSVGIGGNAGNGSRGDVVNANYNGKLVTLGDNAVGVLAQSVGGGGGNSGGTISASLNFAGTGAGSVTAAIGGSGGTGGHGGVSGPSNSVTLLTAGTVNTMGNNSGGIVAQSIGGGGGNGGYTISGAGAGAGTGAGAVSVGLGGTGGSGGHGRNVRAVVESVVQTEGDGSSGVVVQSVGGGGGNGGFNISVSASGAGTGAGAVSVGLGGSGSVGGNGGAVLAETSGDINTFGNQSGGVLAQSVGGGGGNGGFNISGSGSGAGTGSGAVAVGLGGSGAGGGFGSTVGYIGNNNVYTRGHQSSGIVVQSIGGGGGNGGFNVSASAAGAGTGSGAAAVGLGGSSDAGGDGAAVNSAIRGNVVTGAGVIGNDSVGVLVQSVGGGGGNGGFNVSAALTGAGTGSAAAGVSLGGTGGGGGNSSTVVSSYIGDISTNGINSSGLIAQSLGGGGGNGGMSVSGAIAVAKTGSAAASVGIGGSGGSGGSADTVNNTIVGNVVTTLDRSGGVLAQSLGGGGGNGGISVSGTVGLAGTGSGSVTVGIGGSGGSGGTAAKVTNVVTGNVFTDGEDSTGIAAQSIGGGGGNGGINITGSIVAAKTGAGALGIGVGGFGGSGGIAGDVDNTVSGYVQTKGKNSVGSIAQSVGGGGGNGALNITGLITASKSNSGSLGVGIGGFGGSGGNAGNVTNLFTGGAYTEGENADGIVAQSLGGGGGNGGINVTGSLNLSKDNGGTLGVGIGGFGGGAGNSGDVTSTVNTTATYTQVTTKGDNSTAVLAQSLGGGGGNGGINVTGAVNLSTKNSGAMGVGIGGFGGSGGDSGAVSLAMTGNVMTLGSNSHGVVAQSLAGGGGNGALNITGALALSSSKTAGAASIGIGGFGGSGGNASDVTLSYEGTINSPWMNGEPDSTAKGSHGILAQSLGGGGGNGGVNVSAGVAYSNGSDTDGNSLVVGIGGFGGAGGNAGNVGVTVTGGNSITAHGDSASAIFAQSLGGGGGNGGVNISGGFASSSPVVFGVGGFGGGSGTAGNVSVISNSDLYANGTEVQNSKKGWAEEFADGIGEGLSLVDEEDPDRVGRSTGITAQSIGGGGGNGGLNISGGGSFNSKDTSSSLVFGVGGFGGAGSVSGEVSVVSTGYIQTVGDWSHGIMAQSLAGGGGNGGINIASAVNWTTQPQNSSQDVSLVGGIGGFGGSGADAGNVVVNSNGDIVTKGAHSRGILAQSIGGGGGTGGMNVTTNVSKGSSPLTLGIGGFGSGGGHAGSVSVTRGSMLSSAGVIITDGTGSHGLEASSIGGGGGDAGANFSLTYTSAGGGTNDKKDDKPNRSVPANTGVDASVLTNYNAVLDELEGRKSTNSNPGSPAKKAYAGQIMIGGAGGESGNGGAVDVHQFGDIETKKGMSHGVFAQSIGGGGGNASFNIAYSKASNVDKSFDLSVGGATGDGGKGASVFVEHSGIIITGGNDSVGVFGQSVGGGGGNAGMDMVTSSGGNGNLNISLGRMGGTGGEGGSVTMITAGTIQTSGNNSHGLLAQSVGSGGGNSSATTIKGKLPDDSGEPEKDFRLSVGLEGGVGGFAGAVDVTSSGSVSTTGQSAHAIFAQSVGGGGGNAGSASLGSKIPTEIKTQSYGLAIGGKGGVGGYGGSVTVANTADLSTSGESAIGILAQSVGGGGGTGGSSTNSGRLSQNGNVFVNIGGGGGTGAVGGDIEVANSGVIVTTGARSHGVLAQTIGGGGGQAGMTLSGLKSSGSNASSNLSVIVGGSGGDSNSTSGSVLLTNTGGVETFEEGAIGLFAQSVGGGGGNANSVIMKNISTGVSESKNNDFSLAVGGSGGIGGTGGAVTVNNLKDSSDFSGQVVTHGQGSHAIVAMSIGGGGGQGSSVTIGNKSKMNGASRSLTVGGSGSIGGTSDVVTVNNSGDLYTHGDEAHGILAQSIGGGGGNAGDTSSSTSRPDGETTQRISIGGTGGDGNRSGNVIVTNSGTISTTGKSSFGILAQSIGGGGGNGSLVKSLPKTSSKSAASGKTIDRIAIGGIGGTGADSGDITVTHTGTIQVTGENSYGIYAQSVSGGGGKMGASISDPLSSVATKLLQFVIGAQQTEGKAGEVNLDITGDINVSGTNSHAVFQQSVNGGGGDVQVFLDLTESAAALSVDSVDVPENLSITEHLANTTTNLISDIGAKQLVGAVGTKVASKMIGNIYSSGDSSSGSTEQSVGGGGGQSHLDIDLYDGQQADAKISLGGNDNTDSSGGDVKSEYSGNITIVGSGGAGSRSQSIGGGGGISTLNFKTTTPGVEPLSFATASLMSVNPGNIETTTSLGAQMGSGNDGGVITSTMSGNTVTEGDRTFGIIRQSIGAGGGVQYLSGVDVLTTNIGGSLGAQGHGGAISLSNEGNVQTDGILSHGIVLQSIGGGGGIQLSDTDEANVILTRSADNSGDGEAIMLDQTGNVVVFGDKSIAVLAQSLGGGGGVVDSLFADTAGGAGASGDIALNFDGSVVSAGKNGAAVFAQSRGADGRGDIGITLAADKMISAGAGGVGVHLSGGLNNSVVSRGSMFTDDGLAGSVIRGEEGNDVVESYGMFLGQFDLAGGANEFTNHLGGQFVPGPVLSLGSASNNVTNHGVMMPGNMNLAQRSDLNGGFIQSSSGLTYSELDFASGNQNVDGGIIDRIYMSGAASLAGEIDVSLLNPQLVPFGNFQKTLFNADLGVTNNGMTLSTAPSVVINYDLIYPTATQAVLDYTVDFSPDGENLGQNLNEVGDYFNRIQAAGSSPALADTVIKMLYDPTMVEYRNTLSQMGPDFYGELQASTIKRSERFGHLLVDGSYQQITGNDYNFWYDYETDSGKRSAHGDYKRADSTSEGFAFGVEKQIKEDWLFGAGLSVTDHKAFGYGGRWQAEGENKQLGIVLKHNKGDTEYAASLTYGWGGSDVERTGFVTAPFTASSDRQLKTFSGMFQVAHTYANKDSYIRPTLGLGFTHLMADSVMETGAGALNLQFQSYEETHAWARLGFDLGRGFAVKSDHRIVLRGKLGLQYYLTDGYTTARAGLEGAPAGIAPMGVNIDLNRLHGYGSIGVDWITPKGVTIGVDYSTILDGHSTEERWNFGVRIPF